MKDYSQAGEQKIILDYFQPPRWPYLVGRVLDIGANDGETFSMSRALIQMGWGAILVEPSRPAFQKLLDLYAPKLHGATSELSQLKIGDTMGVTLVQAAITDKNGPVDFYDSGTHLKKGDVALLSTTVPKEMDRWKKSGEQFTKTTVRGITFDELMRQTGETRFDMISIDAEGLDFAILSQIDLDSVGCKLLCIEFNQSKEAAFLMTEYCMKHGMKLLHRTYENLIFAR